MGWRLNPWIQFLLRTLGNYFFLCSSPIQNVAERRVANVEGRVEGAMLKYGPWKTGGAWKHCVPGSAQCLWPLGDGARWRTETRPWTHINGE